MWPQHDVSVPAYSRSSGLGDRIATIKLHSATVRNSIQQIPRRESKRISLVQDTPDRDDLNARAPMQCVATGESVAFDKIWRIIHRVGVRASALWYCEFWHSSDMRPRWRMFAARCQQSFTLNIHLRPLQSVARFLGFP